MALDSDMDELDARTRDLNLNDSASNGPDFMDKFDASGRDTGAFESDDRAVSADLDDDSRYEHKSFARCDYLHDHVQTSVLQGCSRIDSCESLLRLIAWFKMLML